LLNYIATCDNAKIIKEVCKQQNILILHEVEEYTDLDKYIKETKVNYNLVKFFIIDVSSISDKDDGIITTLYNFIRLYKRIRIILIFPQFENKLELLSNLLKQEIYNLITNTDNLKNELLKCLSVEGKTKKDVQKFEIVQEVKEKSHKIKGFNIKIVEKLSKSIRKQKFKKVNKQPKIKETKVVHHSGVYFFELLLEAITRLIKLIGYILVFLLTSIALTILLNQNLRELVFGILINGG
jgi:hypothetical protein